MKGLILSSLLVFLGATAFAHEGHDKTPGAGTAPHGGVIQGTDHMYLELVASGDDVKLYPLDHEMKAIALAQVKVDAKATFPKKAKGEPVKFSVEGDAFAAKIKANGAHRYTLDVSVSHDGKNEKAKFTVEPQ